MNWRTIDRPGPVGCNGVPDFYVACQTDVRGWGGGLTLARQIANELVRSGGRTTLLGVARGNSGAPGPQAQSLPAAADDPIPCMNVELNAASRWGWRFKSWHTAGRLADALREMRPPRQAFVSTSPFWCVASRRAWPSTPSVYVFPCLLANCLPFVWLGSGGAGLWRRLELAAVTRCERAAFRSADRILAPTRAAIDEIVAFEPSARERIERCDYGCRPIPFDVDARRCVRRELGLADEEFVILAAGVIDRNKAFDLLIRELPRMEDSIRVIVAGDGPERAALATGLGVADRARFVAPGSNLAPYLAAADAVVSTSHYDTFPNVLLEALSAGRPVIAPRHDPPRVYAGIAEFLAEEGGGALYSRGTPGALAEAINRLVRQPTLRNALADQALRLAAERLSRSTIAAQVFAVCGGAVATAGRASDKDELQCLTLTQS